MLHAAASTFEVIQFQIDRGGPAFAALCREFERLESLVELLQQRRTDPGACYGQRFALELIERGTFEIPSLTNASISRATASLVLRDKSVFYTFDNDPDLLLGASFMADGFPLAAIVIPSQRVMVNLGDPVWGMGSSHLAALQRLSLEFDAPALPAPDASRVTVVTGDANFAHNVWNQLSAIEALVASTDGKCSLEILATHEPLGPLRELFPDAPALSVTYCPDSYLEARNASGRMFAALGSFRLSRRLQRRLQHYASSRLPPEVGALVERIAAVRRPTVWLSIRTRNRTAVNQIDALEAVASALLAAYPALCILLDGHSLPADFATNPSYDRDATLAIVEADRAVARDVTERLRAASRIGPRQDVFQLVGCDIRDSLALAALADFYFCHHGTVQHKIGWLTDVPGIVHCNRRTLALHPARWVAAQVEGGTEPEYISSDLIDDEDGSPDLSEVDDSLRIECYRFNDLKRLTEFVLAAASEVLSDGEQPQPAVVHIPSVSEDSSVVPVQRHPGERNAMSPTDTAEPSSFEQFDHVDRLALQRELLRVRNGLSLAQKAKEAVTSEFVRVCGDVGDAQRAAQEAKSVAASLRDEALHLHAQIEALKRELTSRDDVMREDRAELTRRTAVAQHLSDELVRRDLEIAELHAQVREIHERAVQLESLIDRRTFSTEGLLALVNVQRSAIEHLRVPPPAPPPGRARRAVRMVRRLTRRFVGLVLRTSAAR